MPELPEVETIARWIRGALLGRQVVKASLERPDLADDASSFLQALPGLSGQRLEEVERRGKLLRLRFGEWWLYLHLGMSGRLLWVREKTPWLPHTHFRLLFEEGWEMRLVDPRRFGRVGLAQGRETPLAQRWGSLGPDALEVPWEVFVPLFRRRRSVKGLLLDQSLLAGVGNLYADETLFLAGVHPRSEAAALPLERVRHLHKALQEVLLRAIEAGGSTLRDYRLPDGSPGDFQRHRWVYGRWGKPCSRCSALIQRLQVAGRTSHFCPQCQVEFRSQSP